MKKKRPQWLPVVTALLTRRNQILLGQRPEGQSLAGIWEFPGGKIELGETPEQALERELQEELGIAAEVGQLCLATTHSYNETGILLLFYEVNYWKKELKPMHHADLKWVAREDLKKEHLPEANKKVLDELLTALNAPE